MFCLKCGAVIRAGETSCPRCHAPVESKKVDSFNSFKEYSRADYHNEDFRNDYSPEDYRNEKDAPQKQPEAEPSRFQVKTETFRLNSSSPSKFQIKPGGFNLHSSEPSPSAAESPSQALKPLERNPGQLTPNTSQPALSPIQQTPLKTQPTPTPSVETPKRHSEPASVPTWMEDSPDIPPTPLASIPQTLFQPGSNTSSPDATPHLYGHSNFGAYQPDMPHDAVNNHLGLAIFTMIITQIFCCFPIGGLIAMFFSTKSRDSLKRGNYESAKRYSRISLWISLISIFLAVIMRLLLIIYSDSFSLGKLFQDTDKKQTPHLNNEPSIEKEIKPSTKEPAAPKQQI